MELYAYIDTPRYVVQKSKELVTSTYYTMLTRFFFLDTLLSHFNTSYTSHAKCWMLAVRNTGACTR